MLIPFTDGVKNLGWKFYIVWAVLNLANAIIVWMFYPETGGQPLEAVDALFVDGNRGRRASSLPVDSDADIDMNRKGALGRLQWSVVRKADRQVKAYKRANRKKDPKPTMVGATQRQEQGKAHGDQQELAD